MEIENTKMDGYKQKLLDIAAYFNTGIEGLAEMLEVPYSTLQGYISRPNQPKISILIKLLKLIPNLNINWFLFDDPRMFVTIDQRVEDLQQSFEKKVDSLRQEFFEIVQNKDKEIDKIKDKLISANEEIASYQNKTIIKIEILGTGPGSNPEVTRTLPMTKRN